jgi:glycosyltransferase involved in cell wall biosynthesis
MKNICILSRHSRQGASSRLRTIQYVEYLQESGYAVDVYSFFDDKYLSNLYNKQGRLIKLVVSAYFRRFRVLLKIKNYDCIWIEKELFPYLPSLVEAIPHILKIPYILDYDDAIFHVYDQSPKWYVRAVLGGKLRCLIAKASAVTVGNIYLEKYVKDSGGVNVAIIPTVVDLRRYVIITNSPSNSVRIGWIGTPQTAKYLAPLAGVFERLSKRVSLKIVIVGTRVSSLNQSITEYHEWSEANEVSLINSFHIGIMPIPDEPFERGKCGYKLIQYMALEKPVVASPVGANIGIVDSSIGFLAKTEGEWEKALLDLCASPELRLRLGKNGRKKVENLYCTNVTVPLLIELFKGLEV